MKRKVWGCVLVLGLVASGSVAMGDFFVIPVPRQVEVEVEVEKENYAPVARTGQTESDGTGDDGEYQAGVAWPVPRFTDNLDGTVTDNLTGLVWTRRADCAGQETWHGARAYCNWLGHDVCGLRDGSAAGDWRLANLRELHSLIHYAFTEPAVPNTAGTAQWTPGDPFNDLRSASY